MSEKWYTFGPDTWYAPGPRLTIPMRIWRCAIVAAGLLGAGCAAPRTVGEYLGDRGRDLVDCVRVAAGYGLGLHARVHTLVFAAAGMGAADTRMFGWDGQAGAVGPSWSEENMSVFLWPLGYWERDLRARDRREIEEMKTLLKEGVTSRTGVAGCGYVESQEVFAIDCDRRAVYWRVVPLRVQWADRYAWLGAGATAGIVSAKAGWNVAETVDFLLGIACLDPLGDDHWVAETPAAADAIAAGRRGDGAALRALLARDPRLAYARDDEHNTLLHVAAERGDAETVAFLIESGCDVNARGKGGAETIQTGSDTRPTRRYPQGPIDERGDFAHTFLGVTSRTYPAEDRTPLHVAAGWGWLEVVRVLLQNGADPRATGCNGDTPLHDAARSGSVEAARLLLEYGADLSMRTIGTVQLYVWTWFAEGGPLKDQHKGKTPLDLAEDNGNYRMAEFLSRWTPSAAKE